MFMIHQNDMVEIGFALVGKTPTGRVWYLNMDCMTSLERPVWSDQLVPKDCLAKHKITPTMFRHHIRRLGKKKYNAWRLDVATYSSIRTNLDEEEPAALAAEAA